VAISSAPLDAPLLAGGSVRVRLQDVAATRIVNTRNAERAKRDRFSPSVLPIIHNPLANSR
jgi:hypothetical protein